MRGLEWLQLLQGLCIIAHSTENIAIVNESVAEDPNVSIPHRSQELGLSYGTLWRILHLDLHLHPYKAQLMQQLKPADHSQRRSYVEWMLEQQAVNSNFSNKIFFNDEAYFTLAGTLLIRKRRWRTITVNLERYGHMITDFFCLILKNTTPLDFFVLQRKIPCLCR